jgi:hypothetical protein
MLSALPCAHWARSNTRNCAGSVVCWICLVEKALNELIPGRNSYWLSENLPKASLLKKCVFPS